MPALDRKHTHTGQWIPAPRRRIDWLRVGFWLAYAALVIAVVLAVWHLAVAR